MDELSIYPLTEGLANYTGRMKSIMVDTSGKKTTIHLVETGLMIKRKDAWKLLAGKPLSSRHNLYPFVHHCSERTRVRKRKLHSSITASYINKKLNHITD